MVPSFIPAHGPLPCISSPCSLNSYSVFPLCFYDFVPTGERLPDNLRSADHNGIMFFARRKALLVVLAATALLAPDNVSVAATTTDQVLEVSMNDLWCAIVWSERLSTCTCPVS